MFGRRLVTLGLSALFLSAGCGQQGERPVTHADETVPTLQSGAITLAPPAAPGLAKRPRRMGDIEYIRYPDEPMKPASRSLNPLLTGKADAAGNVRHFAPQNYAITEAPPEGIRPMVEWEPMKALVMSLPTFMTGDDYENSRGTVVEITKNTATVAEVWFIMEDQVGVDAMKSVLLSEGMAQTTLDNKVKFLVEQNDTVWTIDFGPLPIIDDATDSYAFADFRYYTERAIDDGLSTILARNLTTLGQPSNIETYRMPLNTEGGTFQATEDGICFTGDGQLFWMSWETGNPDESIMQMSLAELQTHPFALEVASVWKTYAGCEDVIVTHSITDDATLHIDMYMKVLDNNTVLMGDYGDGPFNPDTAAAINAERMDANAAFLAAYEKPDGTTFEVKRLIMPGHRQSSEGWQPFTYANSTIINGLNLWPAFTFDDWVGSRDQAQAEWDEALPEHQNIWIDSEELSFWSGAIHCITRTIPDKTPMLWVGDGTCADDICQAPELGYTGDCTPNDIETEVCWGPEWLCECNDCTSACDYVPTDPPEADLCSEVECGSYTPNNGIGCSCDAACVEYEDCCEDACDTCGFGCDGTDPDPDPQPTGCNGITYEGCCDGEVLTWCENDALQTIDCGENPQCGWAASDGFYNCGTDGSAESTGAHPKTCQGGTVDPPDCVPDCGAMVCGDDGCGGSCGTCAIGSVCTNEGQCVELCEPSCEGMTCGDDGCGGFCGTCAEDVPFCVDGSCVAACTPDCGDAVCGDDGCGGSCGDCVAGEACETGACVACTASCDGKTCGDDGCGGSCGTCAPGEDCTLAGSCVTLCAPDCAGQMCGGDGCGGSCGDCVPGQTCNAAGQCEAICTPDCSGKECGTDGCDGDCGACDEGWSCGVNGLCMPPECQPSCDGKSCGEDGCGGTCGTCGAGQSCVNFGCQDNTRTGTDASGSSDDATSGTGGVGPVDPNDPSGSGTGTGTGTTGPGTGTAVGGTCVEDGECTGNSQCLNGVCATVTSGDDGGCQTSGSSPLWWLGLAGMAWIVRRRRTLVTAI